MLVLVNCVIKKCSDGCLIQLKENETRPNWRETDTQQLKESQICKYETGTGSEMQLSYNCVTHVIGKHNLTLTSVVKPG